MFQIEGSPAGTIYFDRGQITFARASWTPDLSARLLGAMRPSPESRELLTGGDRPDRDIGTILIQRNYLSRAELQQIVRSVVVDAIIVLTTSSDEDAFISDVRFTAPVPHWAGSFSCLDFGAVQAEATRRAGRMARSGLSRTTPVQLHDLARPAAVLSRQQWAVACTIDGAWSAQDLAWQCGLALYEAIEDVGALVEAGLCAPCPAEAPASPPPARRLVRHRATDPSPPPPPDFAAPAPAVWPPPPSLWPRKSSPRRSGPPRVPEPELESASAILPAPVSWLPYRWCRSRRLRIARAVRPAITGGAPAAPHAADQDRNGAARPGRGGWRGRRGAARQRRLHAPAHGTAPPSPRRPQEKQLVPADDVRLKIPAAEPAGQPDQSASEPAITGSDAQRAGSGEALARERGRDRQMLTVAQPGPAASATMPPDVVAAVRCDRSCGPPGGQVRRPPGHPPGLPTGPAPRWRVRPTLRPASRTPRCGR